MNTQMHAVYTDAVSTVREVLALPDDYTEVVYAVVRNGLDLALTKFGPAADRYLAAHGDLVRELLTRQTVDFLKGIVDKLDTLEPGPT